MPAVLPAARVRPLFPIDLGPYRLRAFSVSKDQFTSKRNLNVESDLNLGVLRISDHLQGRPLLEAFLRKLAYVMHYIHGVHNGRSEEEYTYSFSAGMVEFARRNPAGWRWFNRQLALWLKPKVPFEAYISPSTRFRAQAPGVLKIEGSEVQLAVLDAGEEPRLWAYYVHKGEGVRLQGELVGPHLAVIALHEVTHALHRAVGLKDGKVHADFSRGQAQALLPFIRDNPRVWCWFVTAARSVRRPAHSFVPSKGEIS